MVFYWQCNVREGIENTRLQGLTRADAFDPKKYLTSRIGESDSVPMLPMPSSEAQKLLDNLVEGLDPNFALLVRHILTWTHHSYVKGARIYPHSAVPRVVHLLDVALKCKKAALELGFFKIDPESGLIQMHHNEDLLIVSIIHNFDIKTAEHLLAQMDSIYNAALPKSVQMYSGKKRIKNFDLKKTLELFYEFHRYLHQTPKAGDLDRSQQRDYAHMIYRTFSLKAQILILKDILGGAKRLDIKEIEHRIPMFEAMEYLANLLQYKLTEFDMGYVRNHKYFSQLAGDYKNFYYRIVNKEGHDRLSAQFKGYYGVRLENLNLIVKSWMKKVEDVVRAELPHYDISPDNFQIYGRVKAVSGFAEKIIKKGGIEKVFDFMGLAVVVGNAIPAIHLPHILQTLERAVHDNLPELIAIPDRLTDRTDEYAPQKAGGDFRGLDNSYMIMDERRKPMPIEIQYMMEFMFHHNEFGDGSHFIYKYKNTDLADEYVYFIDEADNLELVPIWKTAHAFSTDNLVKGVSPDAVLDFFKKVLKYPLNRENSFSQIDKFIRGNNFVAVLTRSLHKTALTPEQKRQVAEALRIDDSKLSENERFQKRLAVLHEIAPGLIKKTVKKIPPPNAIDLFFMKNKVGRANEIPRNLIFERVELVDKATNRGFSRARALKEKVGKVIKNSWEEPLQNGAIYRFSRKGAQQSTPRALLQTAELRAQEKFKKMRALQSRIDPGNRN